MGAFGVFGSRLVGPAIWLVTLLLDRFVFFYVVPLFPQTFFEFDPDKHGGVGFGGMEFDTGQGTTEAPVVSPVFTDREYARRLFEWMLSWNAGEANDAEEGNIAASLVLESDSYFLCCYPSIGRGRVKRFLEGVHDTQLKEGDPMLEQGRIVVMCPSSSGRTCRGIPSCRPFFGAILQAAPSYWLSRRRARMGLR